MPERQDFLKSKPELTYRPTTRRTRRVKPIGKVQLCGLLLVVAVIGLAFTFQAISVSNRGIQIDQMEQDISSLQSTKERLQLEIARLQSLDRVEKVATNQLGMQPPTDDSLIILASMEDEPTDQVALASQEPHRRDDQAVRLASRGTRTPVIAIVNSFSKWFWGERQVEAAQPE
ncbi:MAG: cell division protein FtsL [Bacillota bacterium]